MSCIKCVRCCSYQHALQHDSCMSVRMRRRLGIACHKYATCLPQVCNRYAMIVMSCCVMLDQPRSLSCQPVKCPGVPRRITLRQPQLTSSGHVARSGCSAWWRRASVMGSPGPRPVVETVMGSPRSRPRRRASSRPSSWWTATGP